MERSLHVRLPEVLASKLDRFAEAEGMTQSELVRLALRSYFASVVKETTEAVSREVRPKFEAEGITEEQVVPWYKSARKKRGRTKVLETGATCA